MPELPPLGGGGFERFAGLGPVLSYREVHQVTDGVERYLQHLIDSYKRHLQQPLMDAGNAGARLEVKILTPIAEHLTPPEELLHELVNNVQNDIAGRLAVPVALLEALGHPYGRMPDMGAGLGQLPSSPPGGPRSTGDSSRFIASGDAAKGRSAGALSAKEQELGVDPAVVDSSSVTLSPTPVGVDYSAPPPGTVSGGVIPGGVAPVPAQSQRASDWLAQCRAQGFGGCDPPYSVWSPPPGGAPNCAVVGAGSTLPGGWTPCSGSYASLDDALSAADACTAAGGVCAPGVVPPAPPTQPPTQPPTPIGTTPPPPPQCCPPPVINVPPCPPPPSIPECVKIEFCDWDQLCNTLKNCLPGAKPEEDCALDNQEVWALKDCDGNLTTALSTWFGNIWDTMLGKNTAADIVQGYEATAQYPTSGVTPGLNPYGIPPPV